MPDQVAITVVDSPDVVAVTVTDTLDSIVVQVVEAANSGGGGAVDSVNGRTGAVVLARSDVGLSAVDNTADVDKPVSTAQASAIAAKQDSLGFSPVPSTRTVAGKALSSDITLAKGDIGLGSVDNTPDANKPVSTAQQSALDLKADLVAGKIPASQLPSYVDDVLEYSNLASFPGVGETGKIYVAMDTGKIYRWSGSVYVEISPAPATGAGTAVLNFEAFPGSNYATVAVSGQASIGASHVPFAEIQGGAQAPLTAEDVAFLSSLIDVVASAPSVGVGFTIYGYSLEKIEGQITVAWRW